MTEEGMARSMLTLTAHRRNLSPSFRGSAKPRARNPGTRPAPGWLSLCSWVPAFAGMTAEGMSRSMLTLTASPPHRLVVKQSRELAMPYGDLTTLGDVKAWLQNGPTPFPATDDALLSRLVTAASRYIET